MSEPNPSSQSKTRQAAMTKTPVGLLDLPGELRNKIYQLGLVREEPIVIVSPMMRDLYHGLYGRSIPGLLLASRATHEEAASIYYGENLFSFSDMSLDLVGVFFQAIGSANSGQVRRVEMGFPPFGRLDADEMALDEEWTAVLDRVASYCPGLHTIEIPVDVESTTETLSRINSLSDSALALRALQMADARFRAISSIQVIKITMREGTLRDELREKLVGLGWTVDRMEKKQPVRQLGVLGQALEQSFAADDYSSDEDWSYERGYYDHGDDDEYDVEYDSDFWRRADD